MKGANAALGAFEELTLLEKLQFGVRVINYNNKLIINKIPAFTTLH